MKRGMRETPGKGEGGDPSVRRGQRAGHHPRSLHRNPGRKPDEQKQTLHDFFRAARRALWAGASQDAPRLDQVDVSGPPPYPLPVVPRRGHGAPRTGTAPKAPRANALNLFRLLFRLLLGRRLPTLSGELTVPGLRRRVTVRRDGWGIPHIDADNEPDAWFGLGFCHGQDRTFQLEVLLRVIRGTLSELV